MIKSSDSESISVQKQGQGRFPRSRDATVSGVLLQACVWAGTQFPSGPGHNAVD